MREEDEIVDDHFNDDLYDERWFEQEAEFEPPFPQYTDDDYEPEIDVCQGCGAYFNWDGVMRQKKIAEMGVQDGASYQRCFNCL